VQLEITLDIVDIMDMCGRTSYLHIARPALTCADTPLSLFSSTPPCILFFRTCLGYLTLVYITVIPITILMAFFVPRSSVMQPANTCGCLTGLLLIISLHEKLKTNTIDSPDYLHLSSSCFPFFSLLLTVFPLLWLVKRAKK
jgi:hypothetical protein